MSCEEVLRRVAERVRIEADAGAPGPMLTVYARLEAEHAIAGHDGDVMDCEPCHRVLAGAG